MQHLLIIEDDPEITSALVRGLAHYGYVAEATHRADQGLEKMINGGFSGAIVDVMLGPDSGVDLVRDARGAGVEMPILMLSALSEVDHRAAGLEAGANDYIVKPFSFDELVARLRVQAQRLEALRPVPACLDCQSRNLTRGAATITLTERECALLALLVSHSSAPLPRSAIFDALWHGDGTGHENVVDVYIGYLRKKLGPHEFGFQINTLRNVGFCIEGLPPRLKTTPSGTEDQALLRK